MDRSPRTALKSARPRNLRGALRSTAGAIDLASIMVGVIVIGVIGGIISATVFAVIPWSQDHAAKGNVGAALTAEPVAKVQTGAYLQSADLAAAGYLAVSPVLAVGVDAAGTCFVAVGKSATGKVFYATQAGPDIRVLTAETTPGCAVVGGMDSLVDAVGGPDPAAAPAPNQFATLTNTSPAGQTADYWKDTASSADGTKMVATTNHPAGAGYIFASVDSGLTWTQTSAGYRQWGPITSSADGTKLAAAPYNGNIVTSTDSGATWTEQAGSGARPWFDMAASSDGLKLIAAGWDSGLYVSADGGVTWGKRNGAAVRNWMSVASSADGTKLVAGEYAGYISTSSDSGATWVRHTGGSIATYASGVVEGMSGDWNSIASSADGTKLLVVQSRGFPCISVNSGASWSCDNATFGLTSWGSAASSADGTKLIVASTTNSSPGIYMSTDAGVTWTLRGGGAQNWTGIGMSADGSKISLGASGNIRKSFTYGP